MAGRQITRMAARVGLVMAVLVPGLTNGASARDGSIQDFFARELGIGGSQSSGGGPVWSEDDPFDRPLVVRPHRKARSAPRAATIAKGPTEPVSIYEDKTLRRGDAVMTANGMRIFRGSNTMPYRDADFVAISESGGLSRDVAKTLMAMDRVPRG